MFAHNVECVPRLDPIVRDRRASFNQSIKILKAKKIRPDIITKSSLMVGVGETNEELIDAMKLVRDAGVDLLTIGQYLAPSNKHLTLDRFPEPELYNIWAQRKRLNSDSWRCLRPFVRSSFKAGLLLQN